MYMERFLTHISLLEAENAYTASALESVELLPFKSWYIFAGKLYSADFRYQLTQVWVPTTYTSSRLFCA